MQQRTERTSGQQTPVASRTGFVLGALLAAASVGVGCIPADIRTVEVPVESEPLQVPGDQPAGENPYAPDMVFPVDFGELLGQKLNEQISVEGVDKDAVESLKMTALSVEVTNPEENGRIIRDLTFLESMAFAVKAGENGEPIPVASSAEGVFDEDERIAYDFEMTGAELVGVLASDEGLDMDVDLETDERPSSIQAPTIVFRAVMTVIIDPVGALN